MKSKRLGIFIAIVGLTCLGAWFALRPAYDLVVVREPEFHRSDLLRFPPSMMDDETVVFRVGTEGIYRARNGKIELASAPGPIATWSIHAGDDTFGIVGNQTYYVRCLKVDKPEFVICENGVAVPALNETDREYIREITKIDSDGKTIVFSARKGGTPTFYSLKDGKLEEIGRRYRWFYPGPEVVLKDAKGAIVDEELARRMLKDPSVLAAAESGRHFQFESRFFRFETVFPKVELSIRDDLRQCLVDGDRFYCRTRRELVVGHDGNVTKIISEGDELPLGKVTSVDGMSVGGGSTVVSVEQYKGTTQGWGIYSVREGRTTLVAESAPIGEFGYQFESLATNGDDVAVIEYTGYKQPDTNNRLYKHRLAVRGGFRSRPVLTSGDQLGGGVVTAIAIGPRSVSRDGNIAFAFAHQAAKTGVGVAYRRRWSVPLSALSLIAATTLLCREFVARRRNRKIATIGPPSE